MDHFYLKDIELQNFRKFDNAVYKLNPHMNVFIGRNASGKTAVLEAVTVILGAYLAAFKEYVPARFVRNISENDVLRMLPEPRKLDMTLTEALKKRRSLRDFSGEPIAEDMVAALLWAANGVNRKNFKRTTPSALNWQDVSVYVVQGNGIWKYLPKRHALLFIEGKDQREHFGEIKTWMKLASQHLVFVSDARKTKTFSTKLVQKTFKVDFSEGEFNERARAINVGTKVQAVYLAAAAMGLGCTCRILADDAKARQLMKLAPEEKIMAICSVGERPASIFDHVI